MSEQAAILVFIKAPVRGRVKSRLAASLGEESALALYRSFALDVLDAVARCGHKAIVCFDPPDAADQITLWLGGGRTYLPQQGKDLGSRMEHAFRSVFSSGVSRAILIGSDLPDLPSRMLIDALDELERHDAVIGPTADGGYCLIGFKKDTFRADVFRNIPWSTDAAFRETMLRFTRTGLSVHQLSQWHDVDTIADLRSLYERSKGTDFERSRTMPLLRKLYGTIK